MRRQKGFTLLEILLVVAAIAILAGIVIVAINPGKQLAQTRNAQRSADVNTILNGVWQYSLDQGSLPATITDGPGGDAGDIIAICKTGGTCGTTLVDLSTALVSDYLVAVPIDPSDSGAVDDHDTGYTIVKDGTRVTVVAPDAEDGATISVSR